MDYKIEDKNEMIDLKNAIQFSDDADIEVIDTNALTTDDIKKSYIGKYIAQCNVCQQLIYVEDKDLTKIEACPYCGFNNCFYIIGQVTAITDDEFEEKLKEEENNTYSKAELVYGEAADPQI